jgi:hypothetical protein
MLERHHHTAGVLAASVVLLTGLVLAPSAGAETRPEGIRWTPVPGQAFNDGWRPFLSGATYKPCQIVRWHFDRSGELPERSTMVDDIRTGLATLEPHTGLTFQEVSDPGIADLTFRWGDLASEGYEGAAGIGGTRGYGKGVVAFDTKSEWTSNQWAGRDWRRLEWPRPDLGPGWYSWREGPGREALVVHEAMHAMGFDHVEDFTSIMYPQGGIPNNRGELSAGDIAGLNTMYLNNPCTVTPAVTPTAATTGALTVSPRKTLRGARVLNSTVTDNGSMSATVRTRLKPGTRAFVAVSGYDTDAQQWTETKQPVRVGKNGTITFTTQVQRSNYVYLRDSKNRMLVRWTTA